MTGFQRRRVARAYAAERSRTRHVTTHSPGLCESLPGEPAPPASILLAGGAGGFIGSGGGKVDARPPGAPESSGVAEGRDGAAGGSGERGCHPRASCDQPERPPTAGSSPAPSTVAPTSVEPERPTLPVDASSRTTLPAVGREAGTSSRNLVTAGALTAPIHDPGPGLAGHGEERPTLHNVAQSTGGTDGADELWQSREQRHDLRGGRGGVVPGQGALRPGERSAPGGPGEHRGGDAGRARGLAAAPGCSGQESGCGSPADLSPCTPSSRLIPAAPQHIPLAPPSSAPGNPEQAAGVGGVCEGEP